MLLKTLHDFFSNSANSEQKLFVHNGTVYDKQTITALINTHIKQAQSFPEQEVVLCTDDNLLFIIGFFALLHAGKTIILATNTRPNTLEALGTNQVIDLSIISEEHINYQLPLSPFSPKQAQVIFFTSGSTGTPKKITKTFYELILELNSVDAVLGQEAKPDTITIATVNLWHLYGMTFAFLYSLAKGFLIDTKLIETPEQLQDKLNQYPHAFLVSSPAFLDRLARYQDNYTFNNKPYMMTSSGGPLSVSGAKVCEDLWQVYPHEVFGSTESGVIGTRQQLKNQIWKLFPFAKAHADSEQRLIVTSEFAYQHPCPMNDAVEFLDEQHFILKGRLDRMIKIEEKRVSLPELEENLKTHPYISKIYCAAVKNKSDRYNIGACINLNQQGRESLVLHGRKWLVDYLKSYMKNFTDKVAIPKKWRFVDELPMNNVSKIQLKEIEALLSSNITEPVVLSKTKSENELNMELVFLKDSSYFEGHFPNFALLPAVAQIHFAMHFAGLAHATDINKMSKIKFSNMIRPGQKVWLNLNLSNDSVAFKYYDDNTIYSSGTINLKGK